MGATRYGRTRIDRLINRWAQYNKVEYHNFIVFGYGEFHLLSEDLAKSRKVYKLLEKESLFVEEITSGKHTITLRINYEFCGGRPGWNYSGNPTIRYSPFEIQQLLYLIGGNDT